MKITLYPVDETLTSKTSFMYASIEELYFNMPEANLFHLHGFKSMNLLSDGNIWLNHDFNDLFFVRFDTRTQHFYFYDRQNAELHVLFTSYSTINLFSSILNSPSL